MNAVAGKYGSSPDELRKRVLPLSGDDLYFFPDGSYIYLDLLILVVISHPQRFRTRAIGSHPKAKSGSRPTLTSPVALERSGVILLVCRRSHPQEILAIGVERDIPYFEKNADRDPEFQLFFSGPKCKSAESVQRSLPN